MKNKFPRSVAIEVAKELQPFLEPVTDRLMCCGSLRRLKPEVGDLELVFVPKVCQQATGLFAEDAEEVDLADATINQLLAKGIVAKRPNVIGRTAWGKLNKLAIHPRTGIGVDFFATTEAHWWTTVVVRTGPFEFTRDRLIPALAKRGYNLHAYGPAGITDKDGNEVPVVSEQEVFQLAGWAWIEPKDRRA